MSFIASEVRVAAQRLERPLGREALGMWDQDMKFVVEPGEFEISAGPNSVHLKTATLTVAK